MSLYHRLCKGDYKIPKDTYLGANWTALIRHNDSCVKEHSQNKNKPFGIWVGVDNPIKLPVGWAKTIAFQFFLINADPTKNLESLRQSKFLFFCTAYCGVMAIYCNVFCRFLSFCSG